MDDDREIVLAVDPDTHKLRQYWAQFYADEGEIYYLTETMVPVEGE